METARRFWSPSLARAARLRARVTLAELAFRLRARLGQESGPSVSTLWRWERAGARGPSEQEQAAIAESLGCALDEITREESP